MAPADADSQYSGFRGAKTNATNRVTHQKQSSGSAQTGNPEGSPSSSCIIPTHSLNSLNTSHGPSSLWIRLDRRQVARESSTSLSKPHLHLDPTNCLSPYLRDSQQSVAHVLQDVLAHVLERLEPMCSHGSLVYSWNGAQSR